MLLQIIGVIAGIAGYFWFPALFMIGGLLCLALDIYGFVSGKLNMMVPIVLYVIGYIYFGSWYGILAGAIVGNAIDPLFSIIGVGAFRVFKGKDESL